MRGTTDIIPSDQTTFSLPYSENEYIFDVVWDELPITVTFMDGDKVVSRNEYNRNELFTAPIPLPEDGYSFAGWKERNSEKVYDGALSFPYSSDDYVLTAVWTKLPITVSFYNNGELYKSDKYEYGVDQLFPTSPEPETGYEFLGWKLLGTDEVVNGSFNNIFSNESYRYDAVWGKIPFSVSFFDGEQIISSMNCIAGNDYLAPLPDKYGFIFKGWSKKGTSTIISPDNMHFSNEYNSSGYSYYAVWEPKDITVSFYDGKRLIESKVYKSYSDQEFPSYEFGEGFSLTGWIMGGTSEVITKSTFNIPYSETEYIFTAYIDTELLTISDTGRINATDTLRQSNAIENLIIPNSIKGIEIIELGRFNNLPYLKSITIPDCVKIKESGIFSRCPNLENIIVSDNNPIFKSIDGILFSKNAEIIFRYPEGKRNTEYTIPISVTTIGRCAFENSRLQSIIIPDSVEYIELAAFQNCDFLSSVVIPGTVQDLGDLTFSYCDKLENVVIEDGVTNIPQLTFDHCYKLSNISIPNSVKQIDSAFNICIKLTDITIPDTLSYIDDGNVFIENVTVRLVNGKISNGLFTRMSIKSVTLPEGITAIGDRAFDDCYNLKTINIPDSVTSIGDSAFRRCDNLTEIHINKKRDTITGAPWDGNKRWNYQTETYEHKEFKIVWSDETVTY